MKVAVENRRLSLQPGDDRVFLNKKEETRLF